MGQSDVIDIPVKPQSQAGTVHASAAGSACAVGCSDESLGMVDELRMFFPSAPGPVGRAVGGCTGMEEEDEKKTYAGITDVHSVPVRLFTSREEIVR